MCHYDAPFYTSHATASRHDGVSCLALSMSQQLVITRHTPSRALNAEGYDLLNNPSSAISDFALPALLVSVTRQRYSSALLVSTRDHLAICISQSAGCATIVPQMGGRRKRSGNSPLVNDRVAADSRPLLLAGQCQSHYNHLLSIYNRFASFAVNRTTGRDRQRLVHLSQAGASRLATGGGTNLDVQRSIF